MQHFGHKFSPDNMDKLRSADRYKMLQPEITLSNLDIKADYVAADIGCGIGFFTLPLARKLGSGRVYAVDTSEKMLAQLTKDIEKENNLKNIETVLSGEYCIPLENGCADIILISMVLHEIRDKIRFLKEVKRILYPGGKIYIIEWVKKITAHGPPLEHRISKEKCSDILKGLGFKILEKNMSEPVYMLEAKYE